MAQKYTNLTNGHLFKPSRICHPKPKQHHIRLRILPVKLSVVSAVQPRADPTDQHRVKTNTLFQLRE
jgi:hypothetical protein